MTNDLLILNKQGQAFTVSTTNGENKIDLTLPWVLIMPEITKWNILPDLLNSNYSYIKIVHNFDKQPVPIPSKYSVRGLKLDILERMEKELNDIQLNVMQL